MKNIFIYCALLIPIIFYGQKTDCTQNINAYQVLFQAKKIDVAYSAWLDAKSVCGTSNESIYKDGLQIIQATIVHSKSDTDKERLLREALKLFDDYHKNFPTSTADFQVAKAMLIYNYSVRADQQVDEIFYLLDKGFTTASESIKDINAINLYYNLYSNKVKNKEIPSEGSIEKYLLLRNLIDKLQAEDPKNTKSYKILSANIDNWSKKSTTVADLTNYYQIHLESNQSNLTWLQQGVTALSVKCSDQPIFYTMAAAFYKTKVTAQSAAFMGLANAKQKKYNETINYYNEAVSLEPNSLEKAKLYYMLATLLGKNDKINAKYAINQALQFDAKMTKGYLFLAQLYADSSECVVSDFDKKALLYLALLTANKSLLPNNKSNAALDKFIAKYATEALTPKEISKSHLNGTSYTISCWINETIVFPDK
ncbi:hypothetical protein OX284_007145 [Flavobacterium sp. SUN046]|uniref:hypothetical protein n=1 Tax=Flavobacterium sp. SUN046 TaxID=3002440 RepID=UPI002DBFE1D7|nr:hypothetical protein [Flavobacterium sp. SUN046]MEC4049200.1 hypothetical protein [Flavobacterium sp. SUN046]